MPPNKGYGKVIAEVAFGRWHWHPIFADVSYIPKGRRTPTIQVHLHGQHNTEIGALRAVIRLISPHHGGAQ